MKDWQCRYCEYLKPLNKPGTEYIGGCEFRLLPKTCGKFELAKCYEGHDPRNDPRKQNDGQLPESICQDGTIAI